MGGGVLVMRLRRGVIARYRGRVIAFLIRMLLFYYLLPKKKKNTRDCRMCSTEVAIENQAMGVADLHVEQLRPAVAVGRHAQTGVGGGWQSRD